MKLRYALSLAVLASGCDEPALQVALGELRHPETLDFGPVPVGTGRTLPLEVENIGQGTVRVESTDIIPNDLGLLVEPAVFFVVPGATEIVQVRLQPRDIGNLSGTLVLRTDLPRAPDREIRWSGRGVRDGLAVNPDPVLFGAVLRGRTATRAVTLTSLLPEPAMVDLAEVRNRGGTGSFQRLGDNSGPLAPGASRTIELTYTPAPSGSAGLDRADAVFSFCAADVCQRVVALEGEALVHPLRCTPNPLDFGRTRPNRRRSAFLSCTNISQRSARILALTTEGPTEASFSPGAFSPVVLEPSEGVQLELRVDVGREALGRYTGRALIQVEDGVDARTYPAREVPLEVRVSDAQLVWTPLAVDFGRVALGQTGTAQVRLENVGETLLQVATTSVSGPFGTSGGAYDLAAGASQELELGFPPTAAGPATGALFLETDAPEQRRVRIPLGGLGLAFAPCRSRLEPTVVDFGAVTLLRTVTRGVQIRNVGNEPCLIREGRLDASVSDPAFTLVEGGEQDVVLEPGEAWTFVVAFRPRRIDSTAAVLQAQLSSSGPPIVTVPLRGSGEASTLLFAPDEVDFGGQAPGCAGQQELRLVNPTQADVTLSALDVVNDSSGPAPFALTPPEGFDPMNGLTLVAGGSLSFSVRFAPASARARSVARVEARTADGRVTTAALYGEGTLDPFLTERWRQAGFPSVDVLIVIDNSSSMQAEQERLRASFPRFLQYARGQQLDYRIGVVTTDTDAEEGCRPVANAPVTGAPQGACGFLSEGTDMSRNPRWRIVEPSEQPSPEVAFAAIADVGIAGSAAETGLLAATLAIEPTRLAGWNQGLLTREDAFFSVLFLSDEDDNSPGDPRIYEAALAAVKGTRFRERFALSGIVIDPDGCGANLRSRYLDAIARSGGTAGSICATNYDVVVDQLARAASGIRDRFVLRRTPFGPSVSVRVDGVPLTPTSSGKTRWRYEPERQAVVFTPDSVPRAGALVEVRYRPRCLSTP